MKLTSTCLILASLLYCGPVMAQARLRVAWKHAMPAACDAGIATDGTLAVIADRKGNVAALNLADGSAAWQSKLPSGASAPAAFTADLILIGDDSGNLHALARGTGELRWSASSGGKITGRPIVAGERVIFGSYDTSVYAVNLADGKQAWSFATAAQVHAPILPAGGLFVTAGCDTQLRALDAAGAQKWSLELSGPVGAAPLAAGNMILVATMDGTVYGVDASGKQLWKQGPLEGASFTLSPVLLNSRLVLAADDGRLISLAADTGDLAPPIKLPSDPSALATHGENLLVGTREGRILILDADGKNVGRITVGGTLQRLEPVEGGVIASTEEGVVWMLR